MFKRNYKYFVSFWYQLDNKAINFRSAYIEINKKIEKPEYISKVRLELKKAVENESKIKCDCISIVNWKKLK